MPNLNGISANININGISHDSFVCLLARLLVHVIFHIEINCHQFLFICLILWYFFFYLRSHCSIQIKR